MPKPIVLLSFVMLLVALVACSPPVATPPAPSLQPAATVKATGGWEALVEAAKKEGKVTMYGTSITPATRDGIIKGFKDKYGIDAELFIAGRGVEMVERLARENRAGLSIADVGMSGTTTITTQVKPLDIMVPLAPLLMLPEVTDASKWRGGKIAYFDQEQKVISLVEFISPSVTINTQMVKPGEIASYQDLLAPKWKGQIALNDPTTGGGGGTWFGATVRKVLGMEKGLAFMRELAAQEPVLSREERQMIEWVARGKYPIAIAISQSEVNVFMAMGAPVVQPRLKEPFHTSTGWANVIAFANPPHPSAGKLLLNWILSQEGSSIISRTSGSPSVRTDVSLEGVEPDLVPTPNDVSLDEDFYKGASDNLKLAKEIFGALLK